MRKSVVLLVVGGAVAFTVIGAVVLVGRDSSVPLAQAPTTVTNTIETVSMGDPEPTTSTNPTPGPSGDAVEVLTPDTELLEKDSTSTTIAPSKAETPGVEGGDSTTTAASDRASASVDKKTTAPSLETEEPGAGTRGPGPTDDSSPIDSPADGPISPSEEGPSAPSDSAQGPTYTWQDGDRTLQATLQPGLTVDKDGAIVTVDKDTAKADSESGLTRSSGSGGQDSHLPVFRSPSGALMTLPGGVLLALDPEWTDTETDAFFTSNEISMDRVSELEWLTNGFFIETEPGFPSLELANELAGQDGVELSSPNWWTERTTR